MPEKNPGGNEKITYNVTATKLEEIENKAAEKDFERQLRRHLTNFTFYLMSSLSIVLPVLFLSKCSAAAIRLRSV